MGRVVTRAAFLILAVSLSTGTFAPRGAGAADDPPAGSLPLPLTGTPTVRNDGKAYVIDGPQVIPPNAEIRVEQSVEIVGIHHASLEVQGGLTVHGTQGNWVKIKNVDFSPTKAPQKGFHLDMADCWNCTFRHAEGVAFDGNVTIENTCLQRDCTFDVRIATGFLRLMSVEVGIPVKIATAVGTKGRPPEVSLRTSFLRDVTLSGAASTTIRETDIRGTLDARNVSDFQLDGCNLRGVVTIRQAAEDSWGGVVFQKCDLLKGARLVLDRPEGPKTKAEKVKVDKFYFEDAKGSIVLDDKGVADLIQDGVDDAKVTVKAWWTKPSERRHNFVASTWRERIPPLK